MKEKDSKYYLERCRNMTYNQMIRQIQKDAIDETCIQCAKVASLFINNLSTTETDHNDYYQCGDDEISIDRKEILELAEILKNELE